MWEVTLGGNLEWVPGGGFIELGKSIEVYFWGSVNIHHGTILQGIWDSIYQVLSERVWQGTILEGCLAMLFYMLQATHEFDIFTLDRDKLHGYDCNEHGLTERNEDSYNRQGLR